jgi:UDP-2-acetamido-3-amino-2,3-dideoxy-glucuronate N-acetyltransferase
MAKVAVIGCGHWGKNLVRNYAELGALGAISDSSSELANKFSTQFGAPALDFEAVLESNCDGVVIAAPAPLHASLSQQAFAAGKHVFVEKPLAMTLEEADEMIGAAARAKRHLMVGHLLQYHPVFARLRDMVKRGDLGELRYVYSNRLSLGKIRSEEDVVWSFAPHDISMILSLVGRNVKTVHCKASDILQPGISDTASLHINFENGINGHVSCSWLHPYKEQKLVVIGHRAMAVFDDTMDWDQKLAVYDHIIDMGENPPVPQKSEVRYEKVPQGEPLKAECQYFLDLIDQQAAPLTDGAEGRRVLQVLAAASESIETGETIDA